MMGTFFGTQDWTSQGLDGSAIRSRRGIAQRRCAVSAVIAMATLGAGQLHAQQATPAPAADQVPDIIVTAQKRSSSLQTTSLAMTALSGDTLKDKSVVNIEGLTRAAPSFSFASQGPTSAINIRRQERSQCWAETELSNSEG